MTLGRSIRIYLADGTTAGIRHAEVINRTCQVLVCHRDRLAELYNWPESRRPGVYALFGEVDNAPSAYIGEAENVFERLKDHNANKGFWTHFALVTSKDENLTKAHVKYLESRMLALAAIADRYKLQNDKSSELASLPRGERDAMEEFLESMTLLLSALGFPILQPFEQQKKTADSGSVTTPFVSGQLRFLLEKHGVDAKGAVIGEGVIVYAGSIGAAVVRDHLSNGYRALRESLISNGALEQMGTQLMAKKDIPFASPSAAAAVMLGGSYNGREAWCDEAGRTLKELQEAAISQATSRAT